MFAKEEFDDRIWELIGEERYEQAELELQDAYAERKRSGDSDGLGCVTGHLADLYSLPMYEDLDKAQKYFEEHELLSPTPYVLRQTTLFYFLLRRDFARTVDKVDEMKSRWDVSRDPSYYSALALKGEALLELGDVQGANAVLEEMLAMIRLQPSGRPYGDEVNLLSASVSRPDLAGCSREILK